MNFMRKGKSLSHYKLLDETDPSVSGDFRNGNSKIVPYESSLRSGVISGRQGNQSKVNLSQDVDPYNLRKTNESKVYKNDSKILPNQNNSSHNNDSQEMGQSINKNNESRNIDATNNSNMETEQFESEGKQNSTAQKILESQENQEEENEEKENPHNDSQEKEEPLKQSDVYNNDFFDN